MYRIQLPDGIDTRQRGRLLLFNRNRDGALVRTIDVADAQARQHGRVVTISP